MAERLATQSIAAAISSEATTDAMMPADDGTDTPVMSYVCGSANAKCVLRKPGRSFSKIRARFMLYAKAAPPSSRAVAPLAESGAFQRAGGTVRVDCK